MLHLPANGHRVFEVEIHNQLVRQLVSSNRRHQFYDERWARTQRRNVVARCEREARDLIAERFPPEDGFIIESVHPSRY